MLIQFAYLNINIKIYIKGATHMYLAFDAIVNGTVFKILFSSDLFWYSK